MKKKILQIIVFMILCIFTLITACDQNPENLEEIDDYAFRAEFISLSSLLADMPNISNMTFHENYVYFTSTSRRSNDSLFDVTDLFKIDLEQSAVSSLFEYASPLPPEAAEGGGTHIGGIFIDELGYVWVIEVSAFFKLLQSANAENNDMLDFDRPYELRTYIKRLDSNGNEELSINLNDVEDVSIAMGVHAFYIYENDLIFLASGETVFAIDKKGEALFYLDTGTHVFFDNFIRLTDGRIAFTELNASGPHNQMRTIDVSTGQWGESISLPPYSQSVHEDASGVYQALAVAGMNLYGVTEENGEFIEILNFLENGLEPIRLSAIQLMSVEEIRVITSQAGVAANKELVTLSLTPKGEMGEKTTLIVASTDPHMLTPAVTEFNRTNLHYEIIVQEIVFRGTTLFREDLDRLALEIIAGRGPDIIHTVNFPFNEWAGRGLFVDLNDMIDNDPEINRDAFIEGILTAAETNGKLYQIFSSFGINAIIGHLDIVGNSLDWTLDEFRSVLDANPQATKAFGNRFAGGLFSLLYDSVEEIFIDWDTGLVNFDSEQFIEILELTYEFNLNSTVNFDEVDWTVDDTLETVASGEQIMKSVIFSILSDFVVFENFFGGNFVFKGAPSETGGIITMSTASGLAIVDKGEVNNNKAWEFVRFFVSENEQRRNPSFSFPSNYTLFNEQLNESMNANNNNRMLPWNNLMFNLRALTQSDIDRIRELVSNVSGVVCHTNPLMNIIGESLAGFFDGQITAEDAARVIQSRVSIFVSERT